METQTTTTAQANGVEPKPENLTLDVTTLPTLEEVKRQYLNLVLKQTGGNKVQAAKVLGVSVKTIYNQLDAYRAADAPKA